MDLARKQSGGDTAPLEQHYSTTFVLNRIKVPNNIPKPQAHRHARDVGHKEPHVSSRLHKAHHPGQDHSPAGDHRGHLCSSPHRKDTRGHSRHRLPKHTTRLTQRREHTEGRDTAENDDLHRGHHQPGHDRLPTQV